MSDPTSIAAAESMSLLSKPVAAWLKPFHERVVPGKGYQFLGDYCDSVLGPMFWESIFVRSSLHYIRFEHASPRSAQITVMGVDIGSPHNQIYQRVVLPPDLFQCIQQATPGRIIRLHRRLWSIQCQTMTTVLYPVTDVCSTNEQILRDLALWLRIKKYTCSHVHHQSVVGRRRLALFVWVEKLDVDHVLDNVSGGVETAHKSTADGVLTINKGDDGVIIFQQKDAGEAIQTRYHYSKWHVYTARRAATVDEKGGIQVAYMEMILWTFSLLVSM